FLVGSFPLTIETPSQIAAQVANAKLLGLGDDYLRLYRERLAAVTPAAARAAAARLYRRGALTIVVVGDATQLYDRLKAIAPVRLVDGDGNPLTPAELSPKAAPVALDPAQLASHTDSSRVLFQGNPVGASVSALRRTADSLVYTEQSNLGGGAFQQTVTLVLDPADGSSRRLDRVTIQQGQRSEAHLTYSGGRVKGRSAMPQQDGTTKPFDIDTVLPPGTIDEDAVPFSVPAFPLESGKSFTVSFFSPIDGAVKLLTFKVGAEESVVVPAGESPRPRPRRGVAGRRGEHERRSGAISVDLSAPRQSTGADPQRDDHDGDRAGDPQRVHPAQGWADRRRRGEGGGAGRRGRSGRDREVRHPRLDRRPLASGRVRGAGHRGRIGRQRGYEPRHGRGLGGAFVLAARPADPPRHRGRDHHHPGAAGVRQPDRRAQRHPEARAGAHGAGDEVPRRPLRSEDGVRREPQAGVRAARRPCDPDGQHGGLPQRVHAGGDVSP